MYFVYLLKCSDGSLYCGITRDLERRVDAHNGVIHGGAKYTNSRRPVKVVYFEEFATKGEALVREAVIKKMKRHEKLSLTREANQQ